MAKTILTSLQRQLLKIVSENTQLSKRFYLIIKQTNWTIQDLRRKARLKFDYYVDPIDLGAHFLLATELKDYPKLLIELSSPQWQSFWVNEAQKLRAEIIQD